MSDVFVSYSKSDRAAAARIAQALADRGLTVWWDREIAFGDSFDRVIERELAQAKSVIVLWSRASVESDWVRNEARRGLGRGVLIPLRIDAVEIPLEFSNVQFADLSDWQPGQPHEAFDRLVQRVSQVIQRPASAGPAAGSWPRPSSPAAARSSCALAAPPTGLTVSMKTNGVEIEGHCFYLANGGQSCSDYCRRLERTCEVDGLAMAARSVTACESIVGALGGPGGLTFAQSGLYEDDLAGCTYGDWGRPDSRWVQVMRRGNGDPTCDAVNADDARMRICACK